MGNCRVVRDPKQFYFKVSTILLDTFTGMGTKRYILSLKAKAKVLPVLLTTGAGKGRFAKLRVRRRDTSVTHQDIQRGRLRRRVSVIAKSVGRTSRVFKRNSVSIVAAGPPCVVNKRKLTGPRDTGTVTERRILYALSSVVQRDTQALGTKNEFCVMREPFQLTRVLATVYRTGLRPGQVHLICPCISGRPGVILVRKVHNTGSQVAIRPPLVICRGSNDCAQRVLRRCKVAKAKGRWL